MKPVIEITGVGTFIGNKHDAAFIEHAPADMTALLAALDAANAEIERLRGCAGNACKGIIDECRQSDIDTGEE